VDEVEDPPEGNPHPPEHAHGRRGCTRCIRHQQHVGRTRNKAADHCAVGRFNRATRASGRPTWRRQAPSVYPTHGAAAHASYKTTNRRPVPHREGRDVRGPRRGRTPVQVHACHPGPVSRWCRSLRQVLTLAFPPQTGLLTPRSDVAPHWHVSIPTAARHSKENS
jgi:hypothetical protein